MNVFDRYYTEAHNNEVISQVINYIKGVEQNNPYHKYNLLEHTEKVVEYLKAHGANDDLILAGWLHDVGKVKTKTQNPTTGYDNFINHAEASVDWINQHFPDVSERVKDLVLHHDRIGEVKKEGKIKSYLGMHDKDWLGDMFLLREADISAQSDFQREEKSAAFQKQKARFDKIKAKEQSNASKIPQTTKDDIHQA
jgi:tRNA nucleotidyltransferase (CCA-adding enzyme)